MSTVRQHLAPLPVPDAALCRCDFEDCAGTCNPAPAPRGNLLQRMVRAARIAALRFDIRSHEQHLAECERDGIIVSDTVIDWTYALQDKRAQLRALELQS